MRNHASGFSLKRCFSEDCEGESWAHTLRQDQRGIQHPASRHRDYMTIHAYEYDTTVLESPSCRLTDGAYPSTRLALEMSANECTTSPVLGA